MGKKGRLLKILVTGASGFLGQAFVEKAKLKNLDIFAPSSKDLNLLHPIRPDMIGKKFDVIIHFASWTRAGDFCRTHKLEQWLVNEKINLNIIDYWVNYQREAHLISFGTSVCYNDDDTVKLEKNYLKNDPIDDYYGYSTTKRSLIYGIKCASQQFSLSFSHYVPSTIYGPGYHLDGRQMHFVYDIIRKLVIAKKENREVVLWGNGYQERELIFIDDVTDILFRSLSSPTNQIINLSSGRGFTIRELANSICEIINFPPSDISYDTDAFTGFKSKILSNTILDDIFPDRKKTDLVSGLRPTIKWVSENF